MINPLTLLLHCASLPAAGGKMKDWDKQESDDDGAVPADQLDGMGGSSDED